MATRLDLQRPPVRLHARTSDRWYVRGYDSLPHRSWGDTDYVTMVPSEARPGNVYVEPTVTAQDATNAAKLGPLGYIANPQTAWTTGQAITVSGFQFNWTGSAWAAGTHALMAQVQSPGNYTIADLQTWTDENPDLADELLAAEQTRSSPRSTLVTWLQGFISHRDAGTLGEFLGQ